MPTLRHAFHFHISSLVVRFLLLLNKENSDKLDSSEELPSRYSEAMKGKVIFYPDSCPMAHVFLHLRTRLLVQLILITSLR